MSHLDKNTVEYVVSHTQFLPELVCGILGQFCLKAVSLWEAIFEHLRLWVFGPRNKPAFNRQKGAVAGSLARLYACVERYSDAQVKWSDTDFTMATFATDTSKILSHIQYLGRGVDLKSYNAERQSRFLDSLMVRVSTVSTGLASKSRIKELSFYAILARKQCVDSAHQDLTSTYPRQVLPFPSPAGQCTPLAPESASPTVPKQSSTGLPEVSTGLFFDSPGPTDERALVQQTEAEILDLDVLIEKQSRVVTYEEQKLHNLEGQRYFKQLMLGHPQTPAHLKICNVFDDQASQKSPAERDLGQDSLSENPLLDVTGVRLYHRDEDKYPLSMIDPMLGIVDQVSERRSLEVKKRKRFSTHVIAKKARTGDNAGGNDACHDHAPHENQATIYPTREQESNTNPAAVRQVQVDDGNTPTKTTRPTSWPRSRLFRRSAGVSVKKLTEVFEKLRLPQDKHSLPTK
ncbi:MAG: hypothetical protein Q9201_005938 [Fulgogasparrea decipioides]